MTDRVRWILVGALLGLAAGPLSAQYTPPSCSAGSEAFTDVPSTDPACRWIEKLARDGITDGCGPFRFCPDLPLTRRQAAVLLEKTLRDRLWGRGRPGTAVYGLVGGLCDGGTTALFGLSRTAVDWGDAAEACPANYWVCTRAERGLDDCNTGRPDSDCDGLHRDGSCFDMPANNHRGWLADADVSGVEAGFQYETTPGSVSTPVSEVMPVWCCHS